MCPYWGSSTRSSDPAIARNRLEDTCNENQRSTTGPAEKMTGRGQDVEIGHTNEPGAARQPRITDSRRTVNPSGARGRPMLGDGYFEWMTGTFLLVVFGFVGLVVFWLVFFVVKTVTTTCKLLLTTNQPGPDGFSLSSC